jgi:hypothetical protein
MALEKIALEDDYFVSRKLYPNVDFYSGIVQRAIGIPVSLFTAIFALARTVGWIAQLNEMIGDPEYKIGRPRQLFVGSVRRDVSPTLIGVRVSLRGPGREAPALAVSAHAEAQLRNPVKTSLRSAASAPRARGWRSRGDAANDAPRTTGRPSNSGIDSDRSGAGSKPS